MTNEGSFIGAQTQIKGNIEADEDLLIMGRVEGDISLTGALQLEADSSVLGDIQARAATIRGSVVGNVTADEMVHITEEGRVVGNVTTARICIDEGAQYSGRVEMGAVQTAEGERTAQPDTASQPAERKATPQRTRAKTGAAKESKPRAAKKAHSKERSRKAPKPPTAAGKKVRTRRK